MYRGECYGQFTMHRNANKLEIEISMLSIMTNLIEHWT